MNTTNYIISLPRSGQHMIESILRYIYSNINKEFKYCEYYTCCKKIGNCNKNCNFQKNHDFWLNTNSNKLPIHKNSKYLVLYRRDKIKQLESYYRFYLLSSSKNYDYNELIGFINRNSTYYDNFIKKWVDNNRNNILKIEYYDLITDPNYYIEKIFYHFENDKIDSNIFNIKDLIFPIYNGVNKKEYKKIDLVNNLNKDIYNKIKSELKW